MFRSISSGILNCRRFAAKWNACKTSFPPSRFVALLCVFLPIASPAFSQTPVFVNEIHYDNTGADAGEAIEVAGPAGTDLTGWSIVLYNGSGGAVYDTDALSGTIPDLGAGFGVVVLNYPANGIQNGAPDGIALVNASGAVIQFLSYEGAFTAAGGPANGMTSIDIGAAEAGTEASGQSLQLSGTGANYEDFTWNSPATASFGAFNAGQTFAGGEAAPAVTSTAPANAATGVAVEADIAIHFSEPVEISGNWFLMNGTLSGPHTAAVSGGPQSFTLNPDQDFVNNETVIVTIVAANITDQDVEDPPDNMNADHAFTFSTASGAAGMVINEILADPSSTTGDANGDGVVNTTDDEFVEVVNASGVSLDISGWTLADAVGVKHTFPAGTIVLPQTAIVVFGGGSPAGNFGCSIIQTATSASGLGLNNAGDTLTLHDGVSNVASYAYGSEGGDDQSLTRDPDMTGPEPLVKHSTIAAANGARFSPGKQVDGTNFPGCATEIFDIQGSGLVSLLATQTVTTNHNVVTALGADGFFMQTPAARSDGNAQTSDGIFVFTSTAPPVNVGDLVNVTGQVQEFFDFTELSGSLTVSVVSSGNALPAPALLDGATPSPNQPQSTTEYERYEGMRVEIGSGVVAGPNQFFASDQTAEVFIVAGTIRPFREPGILFPGFAALPVWDGNPEIFEFDPDRLGQPNANIPAGSPFSATGVLGFEFGGYEFWPTQYSVSTVPLPRAVRTRNTGEAAIATLNMHRFFDDENDPNLSEPIPTAQEYADKLNKFSLYIRNVLGSPDILAVQEAENLNALQDLADKIAADEATLDYTPYLEEGNDIGGIDVGFLVRNGVTVNAVAQLGKVELFTFDNSLLHDRPPLVIDATLPNGLPMIVMNLHQRSLSGIDDPLDGPRVRQKRHEQAVSVSLMVQSLQNANPNLNLVVAGDFNAFEFSDGYVDVLGQIMGAPSNSAQALLPGVDHVNPNLINKILSLPAAERYSFNFGGSAQALDHMLVSQALNAAVAGIEYARGNSDAAVNFETDGSTTLRCSDHDALVLYVSAGTATPVAADAGPDKSICAGASTSIGGSPAASGGSGGPYTFTWSPTEGLSDAGVANPIASPATTTTYTVTVTETTSRLSDTDEVTVTVNLLPIVTFDPVGPFFVRDAPIDLFVFVSPAGGTFSGPGISGSTFTPAAAGVGTHRVTYAFTDNNACTNNAQRDIEVNAPTPATDFVLFANDLVTLDRYGDSEGNVHANDNIQIKRGVSRILTGNLTAEDNITVEAQNIINGEVKAAGEITIASGAKINGNVAEHTSIESIPLPNPSFSAGGMNRTIPAGDSQSLSPGSYGEVLVGNGATLHLNTGKYFFRMLDTDPLARLAIDVAAGAVEINIVSTLDFDERVNVIISSGDVGSSQVIFTTLQTSRLTIGQRARVFGSIVAPQATVRLSKNSRFKGSIVAKEILVQPGAAFRSHASPPVLAAVHDESDFEDLQSQEETTTAASPVTAYALNGNYPNPFNPSTTIEFALPEPASVTLKIYTIIGQLVRTLAHGDYPGGAHQMTWDGKDDRGASVATGIYFYQLVAQKMNGETHFSQTRRMAHVK